MATSDTAFSGSIPEIYDDCLGPLLFEPYAVLAAGRAAAFGPGRVLETAAGTGVVTQALARRLPDARIVATDLNPAMLEVAARRVASPNVRFQPADALDLPFKEGEFDLVVCQFGAMFYPDKVRGNAEARRVLADGGRYLAVIWDALERNPVSQAIHAAVAARFPDDPPGFIARTPFGYCDAQRIEDDLIAAGFREVDVEVVPARSRVSAEAAARGMCQGSPLRAEIEAHGPGSLERATEAAERALRPFDGSDQPMSALFVTATR